LVLYGAIHYDSGFTKYGQNQKRVKKVASFSTPLLLFYLTIKYKHQTILYSFFFFCTRQRSFQHLNMQT